MLCNSHLIRIPLDPLIPKNLRMETEKAVFLYKKTAF